MRHIAFRLRPDGLYQSVDFGVGQRISTDAVITLVYVGDKLAVNTARISSQFARQSSAIAAASDMPIVPEKDKAVADDPVLAAVAVVRENLLRRHQIVDVSDHGKLYEHRYELLTATGYVVNVPGSGTMLAIKPESLRGWVSGEISLGAVVANLKASGILICGADGNSTRQVTIGALGRQRYYCFKPISDAYVSEHTDAVAPLQPPPTNAPSSRAPQIPGRPLKPRRPVVWK
jgi:hypothetical protein